MSELQRTSTTENGVDTVADPESNDTVPAPESEGGVDDYEYDENMTEYDGDLGAVLAVQYKLPTRQQERAAVWDGNSEDGDQSDLAGGYNRDLGTVPIEAADPVDYVGDQAAAQEAQSSPDAGMGDGEPEAPIDDKASVPVHHAGIGRGQGTGSTEAQHAELEGASPAVDTHTATDKITPDSQSEQTERRAAPSDQQDGGQSAPDPPGQDNPNDLSPEAKRIAELEARLGQTEAERDKVKGELDQANQKIADLEARGLDEQDVPSEDDQAPPADTRQGPADTNEGQQAEDADELQHQRAVRSQRENTEEANDANHTNQETPRPRPGFALDQALGIWAASVDTGDVAAKVFAHAYSDAVSPLMAVVVGLVGVGVSKYMEHKEDKNE